ncbi:MAG: hypothetical protein ACRENG_20325, partial [bacterium]
MTTNICTGVREIQDPDAVLAAEREMAAWIAAHNGVPGVEVHADSDATWIVHPGVAWPTVLSTCDSMSAPPARVLIAFCAATAPPSAEWVSGSARLPHPLNSLDTSAFAD